MTKLVVHRCLYDVRGSTTCPNERTLDYDFCRQHLDTPRGRQHVLDVIAAGNLTLPSEVEQVVAQAQEIPEKDIQTTTLERMGELVERVLEWEEAARARLHSIPTEDWRYKSRDGSEQMRTELKVYEQALDRVARILKDTSKMAISDKMVSLGRAQSELMIKVLMGTITDLRLDNQLVDQARMILLQKFKDEANLSRRVEHKIEKELAPMVVDQQNA